MADPGPKAIDTGGIPLRERALTRLALGAAPRLLGLRGLTRWSLRSIGEIRKLAAEVADPAFERRTTIGRILGIEETTRHWSLAQVAEHVIIVNRRAMEIVKALGRGDDPGPMWTILDVKPRGLPADRVRQELEALAGEVQATPAQVLDWRAPARHPHPWFGPLHARGWWALNALHNSVHCRQARRIVEALARIAES